MSAELGAWALAFIAVACLLSGFAHGALGFGFPLLATPLVALVIDIKSAIAILAPLTLVLTVISAFRGGPLMDVVRRFWYVPLAAAAGAWLGTRVLIATPPEPFVLILALVILLYLNLDRLGRGGSERVQRNRIAFGLGFGFVAGIFEAIANVAGPVLLIFFMLLGLAPAQMVQTLNLCFSVGKGAQTLTWAASGEIGSAAWLAIGALAVPSAAALFIGMRVRERIDAETYRRWLRGALWVMAVLLLGQFATQALAADEDLFRAIDQDREQVAASLVARGQASVNARNAARDTALHRAVEKDMKLLAQALVKRGADLDARAKNGETPLHLAALHVEPWFTDLLLAAGADPGARNDDGESVLLWATLSGHIVVAQRLLARGADPNVKDAKGNLPLHAAAESGHLELAKLLLPLTKDPDVANRDGQSAADYARSRGYVHIEKLLKGGD
jgi:hypothetical protein